MMKLKTKSDIEGIAQASRIVAQTLHMLSEAAEPGVSCLELDRIAKEFIQQQGGTPSFLGYQGYPATLCLSVNEQVIHGIPTSRVLKDADVLGIDCGVQIDHTYFGDAACTIAVGKVDKDVHRLIQTTEASLWKGINSVKAGGRLRHIGKAISEYVHTQGFQVVKSFSGHGVGFAVHEEPSVPNYVIRGLNTPLRNGMVIAIEPMVTMGSGQVVILDDGWTVATADNSLAAHFEHTIAIWEDEVLILTQTDEKNR